MKDIYHYEDEVIFDTADYFKVFADSSRLKILIQLLNGELNVGELAELVCLSQSTVSHQLKILRISNLVKVRKEGKLSFYSLDDDHISNTITQGLEHVIHKMR